MIREVKGPSPDPEPLNDLNKGATGFYLHRTRGALAARLGRDSRGPEWKQCPLIQVQDDAGRGQGGSSRGGNKLSFSASKIECKVLEKEMPQGCFQGCILSKRKNKVPFTEM